MIPDQRPLLAHVLYRFDTGGLENGVVNLVNHLPQYRHTIVALTTVTEFRKRLHDPSVECIALAKGPGHGAKLYPALWRLLRARRPAVVHTRNLAALEMQPAAWAAGVPVRVHSEHGRDVDDLDGTSRHHQRLRRLYAPFVGQWIALSQDLQRYLVGPVGLPAGKVGQIYNGVDAQRFVPAAFGAPLPIPGSPFDPAAQWIVGTVGRMAAVKDQLTLARAFVLAAAQNADFARQARLALIGDGPLRQPAQALLDEAGVAALAWLPGERNDVAELMRGLHAFVLPSLAEGISNTILEAMASGLPVIATRVGGNAELVDEGRTGLLVPPADATAMASAMLQTWAAPERARQWGTAARARVEAQFSLDAMVAAYDALYTGLMRARGVAAQRRR